MPAETAYRVRPMQLKVLRDLIDRNDGDINKSVEIFVADYVHAEKKDVPFWTEYAEKIKADPDFLEIFVREQKAKKNAKPANEPGANLGSLPESE